MKKSLLIIVLILCLVTSFFLIYSCQNRETPPIFITGVYDGYHYLPRNWGGNTNVAYATPPMKPAEYRYLLGVRNEESECNFSSADNVYINTSLGFYKEKNCVQPPFNNEYIDALDIKFYIINHISDVIDYDRTVFVRGERAGLPTKDDFSQLTPVTVISDYYNAEDMTLNSKYGCFENKFKGGKYIDYAHHMRLDIPSEIFHFDDGYITVAAVFFPQYSNEDLGSGADFVLTANISYEKKDDNITLLNYRNPPLAILNHRENNTPDNTSFFQRIFNKKNEPPVDSLGYDGGNLLIDMGNTQSAKIGDDYFADYIINHVSGYAFRVYLVKSEGIVYFKNDLRQTYWKTIEECDTLVPFYGLDSPSGLVDPEELFEYMSSFRVGDYIEKMEMDYGLEFGDAEKSTHLNNHGKFTLLLRYTSDRENSVSYFADGWINMVRVKGKNNMDGFNINLNYFVDATWEATRINPSRIVARGEE